MAHIRYTSEARLNGTHLKKFPVILTKDLKVHRLSLQFFLSIRSACSSNTLITYAYHLNDFINQLEVNNDELPKEKQTDWDDVDDAWLESYSTELRRRYGDDDDNTNNYVSQVLRTVISYFAWAQSKGYTSTLIGYDENARVRLSPSMRLDGKSHPLVKRLAREKRPPRTAPLRIWIDAVKAWTTLVNKEQYIRFGLMVDWGVGAGLRAHEICELSITQLPLRETAENATINGKNVYINLVVTKGGKPKRIPVSPVLVKKTWDYIETERKSIKSKLKAKARRNKVAYFESPIIFLSATTGKSLSPRAFSNQVRKAWLNAVKCGALTEDEVVWTHGLRHRFATDLLKGLDQLGFKHPEEIAKHATRHSRSQSLDCYTINRFFEDDNG